MEKYVIDVILDLIEEKETSFDKYMALSKIIDLLKIEKRIYLDKLVKESYSLANKDSAKVL